MTRWINRSHPQVLSAAVILGYITAFFALFDVARSSFALLIMVLVGAGAFGTAADKKIGHAALTVGSVCYFVFLTIVTVVSFLAAPPGLEQVIAALIGVNRLIFPFALVAAALHSQTLQYRRIYFE